jgi:tol-pal system protein YbgF
MTALFRRLPDPFRRPARAPVGGAVGIIGRLTFLLALVLGAGLAAGEAAWAQDANTQAMIDRIDRLQRELVTLQRQVYKGEAPPASAAGAAAGTSGITTTAAARIEQRLSQFEAELRTLTGQVEEAVYRNGQLRERLERLAAETDFRLQQFEQAPRPGAAMQGAPAGQAAPGAPDTGQRRVLGTVSQADLEALRSQPVESASPAAQPGGQPGAQQGALQPGAQQAAAPGYALAGETPEAQYNHAFGLLSQANYGEAELALRAFVELNPQDPLAGNAKYWLGETFYVRQDYQQAAVTFAEAYQEYPNSGKAPDNLLKLGMSLSALGSKPDACGTFVELLKRYPKAAATVIQRAKQERQRLACP